MRPSDRPGLLLLCHGDLSDTALADPACHRLYAGCAETYGLMSAEPVALPGNDLLAGMNESIASFLSSESDGPVEQACLGLHRPGVREGMFRLLSRGSRSIVILGGAGLVLPGQGATVHLPSAVGQVLADNAGLNVCCALPGANPHVTAGLVMASIECALTGRGLAPGPSREAPRIGGDTGVLVVSAPDPSKAMAACGRQYASYIAAAKRLSDNMQAMSGDSPTRDRAAPLGRRRKPGGFRGILCGPRRLPRFCYAGRRSGGRRTGKSGLEADHRFRHACITEPSPAHLG